MIVLDTPHCQKVSSPSESVMRRLAAQEPTAVFPTAITQAGSTDLAAAVRRRSGRARANDRAGVLWKALRDTLLLVFFGMGLAIAARGWSARCSTASEPSTRRRPSARQRCSRPWRGWRGYLPARRASRIDPVVALRVE